MTDNISNGFNSGLLTGINLIDLQKALDTIDHYALQEKLPSFGFWSYLRIRKFHVNVHDKFFATAELRCGVAQGCILGPF